MKPETRLANKIRDAIKSRGHPAYKMHGSRFTVVGFPDIYACVHGQAVHLEVKVPGQSPEPAQVVQMRLLSRGGAYTATVTSVEDAMKIIDLAELAGRRRHG